MLMLTKICVTVLGSGLRLVGMLWEGLSLSAGQFWFKKWKGVGVSGFEVDSFACI